MGDPAPTRVFRRSLGAGMAADVPLLDAVVWQEEDGTSAFRILTRRDVDPAAVADGAPVTEVRPVAGALLIAGRTPASGPIPLPLSIGPATVDPAPAEWDLLDGRNCLLALRLEESVDTVADWLRYHAGHHGAEGAVIINRAPPDSPEGSAEDFAEELEEALFDCPGLVVVVLDGAVPLGKPGLGPESHAYLAPDAPGKDRMEVPAPDPWRAPLGEPLIFEACKWRFLARARAVLALDVTDILTPSEGPSAFDLTHQAANGVTLLVGHRIYPWRVRKGRRAAFGDHICRPFDRRRGIARWGVAPERAGLDNTWRAIRVSYARPDPGRTVAFLRAMAIRVPGYRAAELAPKTSLIEDPDLIALAALFDHVPVRPPVSAPRKAPARATHAGRTCIITTMKNEGPFILEWIAYHRAIGVNDFLVYSNDCTDGTDALLDALQARGLIQHRDNPFRSLPDIKPQHAALQAAEGEGIVQDCGWAICMDVDEFINVRIGDGTLAALYAAMGEANMISLTWRLFGNDDIHAYQDRFVTEQFTRCAPELVRKPHQAWGFKTLFRNIDIYRKLGVHRPKGLKPDLWGQVRWLNGSGRPMPREMFRNGWRSSVETYGYDWVQLNHYACRSAESFLVKRDRGRVNHVDRDQGLNYWFRMNHNAVEDTSIGRMIPAARAQFERLLADPELRALHDAAVAAHRARIAALMAEDDYRAFYAELTGERMQALSKMLYAFGAAVFNVGPGVIPADLHLKPLPEGYFFTVEHGGDAEH